MASSTNPVYITLIGQKLKSTFDPSLIAGVGESWKNFHQPWNPLNKADMRLDVGYDFFRTIVDRVRNYNESFDLIIAGARGSGKSAFGLAAAIIIDRYFKNNDPSSVFSIDQVCFSVQEWMALCDSLAGKGGAVVIMDEVGVSGSLSSRESMSKGNKKGSDVVQLMRTDRIITIYISVDTGRIDKRVRQLTSVMSTPIGKLNNEDTNGYGLAIEADIKYRRTVPMENVKKPSSRNQDTDSGYIIHEVSPLMFAPRGIIHSVVVPHAPADLWDDYEAKRNEKLDAIRLAAQVQGIEDDVLDDGIDLMPKKKSTGRPKKTTSC